MTLSLSPGVQKLIEERVQSGRYGSPEDVIVAALTQLEQEERIAALGAEELQILYPGLREKIAEGIVDADAGKLSDGEEFFARLEREERRIESEGRKTA